MSIDIIFYLKAAGKALLFTATILAAFYLITNLVLYISILIGKRNRIVYEQVIENLTMNVFKGRKLLSKIYFFFTMLFFGLPIVGCGKK